MHIVASQQLKFEVGLALLGSQIVEEIRLQSKPLSSRESLIADHETDHR